MTTAPDRADERQPKRRCTASNRHGEPCRSTAVDASGLCPAHRPDADMVELGRRAGLARARKAEPLDMLADVARIKREIPGLMWRRLERMLADETTGDTAAIRAVTTVLDRFEPLLRDEAAASARRVFAAQVAGVIHAARAALERGDIEAALHALDRAQLDGVEPTVIEVDVDPARMLDLLVEVGLIHPVRQVKTEAEAG